MKGALGDPDENLYQAVFCESYEPCQYTTVSGGHPDHIVKLTYEDFIANHKKHYHPSNARFYLYGKMELEEKLAAAEENLKSLEDAERAIDSAFNTGKADRAEITRGAHDHAEEAVRLVAVAMEADEMADDAARMSVIASRNSDQAGVKRARAREAAARKQAKADHKSASKAAKQAYDAIRFSAPNKLGFMRVIQIMFLLHIFSTLLVLWMTSRDAIAYNS
jgi:hypothetical protein